MLALLWFLRPRRGALVLAYQRLSAAHGTATLAPCRAARLQRSRRRAALGLDASLLVARSSPRWWLFNIDALRKRFITRRSCAPTAACCRRCRRPRRRRSKPARCGGTASCSPASPTGTSCCRRKPPRLTAEEQAFLDGPCEELCRMIDDWDITHRRADLPPEVWDFIKKKGFFAMIIPKKYGGLEFSAYAHSCVLVKLASRSGTAGLDRRRAELARPGRAAAALRHRGAEEPLPAAPGARRGSARASR